jgi:hypothetical protein
MENENVEENLINKNEEEENLLYKINEEESINKEKNENFYKKTIKKYFQKIYWILTLTIPILLSIPFLFDILDKGNIKVSRSAFVAIVTGTTNNFNKKKRIILDI